jgi:hypothetical protein
MKIFEFHDYENPSIAFLIEQISYFLEKAEPNEFFLQDLKVTCSTQFDEALKGALIKCSVAFHPTNGSMEKFTVADQQTITSCLRQWHEIAGAPAYQTDDDYANRQDIEIFNHLANWKCRKRPIKEVLRRCEIDQSCVHRLFDYCASQGYNTDDISGWLEPVNGEMMDECVRLVAIISTIECYQRSSKDLLPQFQDYVTTSLASNAAKMIVAYLEHVNTAHVLIPSEPLAPVLSVFQGGVMHYESETRVIKGIVRFVTANAPAIELHRLKMTETAKEFGRDYQDLLYAAIEEPVESFLKTGYSLETKAELLAALSFIGNQSLTYTVDPDSSLLDKLFSNRMVPGSIITPLIEEGREKGLFSNEELVAAKGDELYKYSIISKYVSVQHFIDQAKNKDIVEDMLGHDLGL